jgi:DNA invertase Pin-like site-specific DNA recombinase
VVVQRLDRLFRNTAEALSQVHKWAEAGITMHLADQGGCSVNCGTATGKMIFTLLAAVATYERDITSERTSSTMRHQARTGKKVSSRPTFGWVEGPAGRWIEHPGEQLAIARIRELGARGYGLRAIGRKLAAEGILCRGHAWHHSLIKSILERDEPGAGQATVCEGPLIRCG